MSRPGASPGPLDAELATQLTAEETAIGDPASSVSAEVLVDEMTTPVSEAERQSASAGPARRPEAPYSWSHGGEPDAVAALRKILADVLLVVPTSKRIASWTWRQRRDVRRWATRELMVASRYEIRSLTPPSVIAPYILQGERERGDALAVAAKAALLAIRGGQ